MLSMIGIQTNSDDWGSQLTSSHGAPCKVDYSIYIYMGVDRKPRVRSYLYI